MIKGSKGTYGIFSYFMYKAFLFIYNLPSISLMTIAIIRGIKTKPVINPIIAPSIILVSFYKFSSFSSLYILPFYVDFILGQSLEKLYKSKDNPKP
jgi:hypothetical protein